MNDKQISPSARVVYIPRTLGGTDCDWLESKTEAEAWAKLLKDAAHMPYRGVEGFKHRGYTVNKWELLK
jgi:hypothetical protein